MWLCLFVLAWMTETGFLHTLPKSTISDHLCMVAAKNLTTEFKVDWRTIMLVTGEGLRLPMLLCLSWFCCLGYFNVGFTGTGCIQWQLSTLCLDAAVQQPKRKTCITEFQLCKLGTPFIIPCLALLLYPLHWGAKLEVHKDQHRLEIWHILSFMCAES